MSWRRSKADRGTDGDNIRRCGGFYRSASPPSRSAQWRPRKSPRTNVTISYNPISLGDRHDVDSAGFLARLGSCINHYWGHWDGEIPMRKLAVITLACLTIGAAIAAGSPARAGFIVDASANAGPFMQISGPVVPFPPTNPFSVPLIPANFEGSTFSSIQLVEQSDFPGTGTAGFLQLTGLNIRNLGGFFQSLTLVVTQTGFTEPTSIGAIQVAMSASVVDPPPVITIDLQGCVNSLTGLNPPP